MSAGSSKQHLAKAIKELSDLSHDGTGQTIVYIKATLTNCAGQSEETDPIEVILTRSTVFTSTG